MNKINILRHFADRADLSPKHIYWRTSVTFPWPVSRLRTVVGSPLVIWLADWPATSRPDHSVTEEKTFLYFLTRPLYFLAVQQELHSHHALSGHSLYVIVVHLCVRSREPCIRVSAGSWWWLRLPMVSKSGPLARGGSRPVR